MDLPIRVPDGNVLRESGGPHLCRCRRRRRQRSVEQFACNPRCDCAVSFRRPRQSVLASVLWGRADGLVWVRTAADTFVGPAFCENAAESRSFGTIADRRTRAGRINRVHKPAMMRSEDRRLGARFRPRFRIRTWCRIKTDSATTDRSPRG